MRANDAREVRARARTHCKDAHATVNKCAPAQCAKPPATMADPNAIYCSFTLGLSRLQRDDADATAGGGRRRRTQRRRRHPPNRYLSVQVVHSTGINTSACFQMVYMRSYCASNVSGKHTHTPPTHAWWCPDKTANTSNAKSMLL